MNPQPIHDISQLSFVDMFPSSILIFLFIFVIFNLLFSTSKKTQKNKRTKRKQKINNQKKTKQIKPTRQQYFSKGSLFTATEEAFYKVLLSSIGDSFYIFAKPRIEKLIRPAMKLEGASYQEHINKTQEKHVDYIICDKETAKVIAVIELDDKSHERKKVQLRDEFVEHAYNTANLPIVRFKTKENYCPETIRAEVFKNLNINRHNL